MNGEEVLVAALVSVLTEGINRLVKFSRYAAVALTVVVSLAGAAAYAYLLDRNFWPVVVRVFTYASAIYAVLLKQLQPKAPTGGTP